MWGELTTLVLGLLFSADPSINQPDLAKERQPWGVLGVRPTECHYKSLILMKNVLKTCPDFVPSCRSAHYYGKGPCKKSLNHISELNSCTHVLISMYIRIHTYTCREYDFFIPKLLPCFTVPFRSFGSKIRKH